MRAILLSQYSIPEGEFQYVVPLFEGHEEPTPSAGKRPSIGIEPTSWAELWHSISQDKRGLEDH
ncbi:hypothetical protein EC973_003712 [Apophysomyces ossiformis]|uniref:Uncharacterized protein n=1 Tax=Apophysomyces ossiformis TaxID=679940 RepID=A0A8H7BFF8_9FUNG|nr:hypothetical protein EC973_003712 [Apophysomyces ossiformis]